jgi:leader peptidase (prepilin peptidase)/N-methyltransferase
MAYPSVRNEGESAIAMEGMAARWRALAPYGGLAFIALAATAASVLAIPGLFGIFGAALALLMLATAFIDARRFIIPNTLTLPAFGLALVDAGLQDGWQGALMALLRGAVLAACFLTMLVAYQSLRGRRGIGFGDVKLAGVAGAWLGWTMLPIAVEIAALAALAVYTLRWLSGGRPVRRLTRVPFGLFFAPAIWLCWLLEATFGFT